MATASIRIREAAEASGVISVNAAAKKYQKYGITSSLIRIWVKKGEVAVAKAAAFTGDTVLLDEASLRKRISTYTPHRDNAARRSRSRTIPEMQARAANNGANGAANAGVGLAQPMGTGGRPVTGGARSSTPAMPRVQPGKGETTVLNTREWLDRFYAFQTRGSAEQVLNAQTKDSYDWTFDRFAAWFPTLPMDRQTVIDYIHGLTDLVKGGPISGGSKSLTHRNLSTFYHWLEREYRFDVPNLTQPRISRRRENALPIWPNEVRAVLSMARNHSEKTLVMLLAQTAVRIGELCTIRPECLHDHWVEVWGKPTRANATGYRKVPVPDEAHADLLLEFRTYKQLVWVDGRGEVKPLAGALESTKPGRAVDMRNPDTYRVRPRETSVKMLQGMLRTLMKDAGVYQQGKLAHSFRRAYQAEFVKNGGDREFYRLIMGHFNVSNMDDLYTHASIEDIVEQARRYAPRSFLKEFAPQGELELGLNGPAGSEQAADLDELLDDEEDADDE